MISYWKQQRPSTTGILSPDALMQPTQQPAPQNDIAQRMQAIKGWAQPPEVAPTSEQEPQNDIGSKLQMMLRLGSMGAGGFSPNDMQLMMADIRKRNPEGLLGVFRKRNGEGQSSQENTQGGGGGLLSRLIN